MITNIPGAGRSHGWAVSEFEHEVELADGVVADLKADYGLASTTIETHDATITMRSATSPHEIRLTWGGLTSASIDPTGPIIPVEEDGLTGIIGIRLMNDRAGDLEFEVEADWFRMTVRCATFTVEQHPQSERTSTATSQDSPEWWRMGYWALPKTSEVLLDTEWHYPEMNWTHSAPGLELSRRGDLQIQEVWLREPEPEHPIHGVLQDSGMWEDTFDAFRPLRLPGTLDPSTVRGYTVVGYDEYGSLSSLADAILGTPLASRFDEQVLTRLGTLEEAEKLLSLAARVSEQMNLVLLDEAIMWCVAAIRDAAQGHPGDSALDAQVAELRDLASAAGFDVGGVTVDYSGMSFALGDPARDVVANVGLGRQTWGALVAHAGETWLFNWHQWSDRSERFKTIIALLSALASGSYSRRRQRLSVPGIGVGQRQRKPSTADAVQYLYGNDITAQAGFTVRATVS